MADSTRSEIEGLIRNPKSNIDLDSISPEFWDRISNLTNVEAVEMVRNLLVLLAKRYEGEGSDSYSSELQQKAVQHILDLFQESVQ